MSAGEEQPGEPRNCPLSRDLEVSQEVCRKQTSQTYDTSSDFSAGIIQITFPGSQFAETTEAAVLGS